MKKFLICAAAAVLALAVTGNVEARGRRSTTVVANGANVRVNAFGGVRVQSNSRVGVRSFSSGNAVILGNGHCVGGSSILVLP